MTILETACVLLRRSDSHGDALANAIADEVVVLLLIGGRKFHYKLGLLLSNLIFWCVVDEQTIFHLGRLETYF